MARYGVIDLGSNSVRLVVYEVREPAGESPRFRDIVNEKKMAGLSAYVADGLFGDAGIEKAAAVLKSHLKTARDLDCRATGIFATAVLRNARNGAEATSAIEQVTGAPIDVLSAQEEAYLGLRGASLSHPLECGTLIDIGGGSTELTALGKGENRGISLPFGCVSAYARHVAMVIPTAAEALAIADDFNGILDTVEDEEQYLCPALFAIGGSARAVAKMRAQVLGLDAKPAVVDRAAVESLFRLLGDDPSAFAHNAVKAVPERVHTVAPGLIILRTLMDRLGAERFDICKYGIREGYLVTRMLGGNRSR